MGGIRDRRAFIEGVEARYGVQSEREWNDKE